MQKLKISLCDYFHVNFESISFNLQTKYYFNRLYYKGHLEHKTVLLKKRYQESIVDKNGIIVVQSREGNRTIDDFKVGFFVGDDIAEMCIDLAPRCLN